jgi:hypothetical protein
MKKVCIFVLVLLVSVSFVTAVFAQAKPADAPAAAAEKAVAEKAPKAKATMRFAGVVEKVDGTMVTVKGKKQTKTFDVAGAKFMEYKDAAEIKAGDRVGVLYEEADGKTVAKGFAKARARGVPREKPATPPDKPAEPAKQ